MSVQSTLDSFKGRIGTKQNDPLDYDGQCTGASNTFVRMLGKRPFTGNANQWAGQNHDQWIWVNNTPSAVPVAGSIMCYNPNNSAVGTGPFAHVDIYDTGNVNNFNALDQNWDGIQVLKEVHHNSYAGIAGWLVPIEAAPTPPPAPVGGTASVLRTVNVRTAPSTGAAVTSVLQAGNTFGYQNKVEGQSVTQNGVTTNIWYHSNLGHYVWAGNCQG